jgi:hypothetical protein
MVFRHQCRRLCRFSAAKVVLVGQTFVRCGTDLARFSDMQVSNGLNYILNNVASDIPQLLRQKSINEELRVDTVLKMKHLYRDCFATRCSVSLSHLDEPGAGPLNAFCYMLWDVSPLGSWNTIVLDVMEDALYMPHDACIESALHGLGHRYGQDKIKAPEIISCFLSKTRGLRPELKRYAERAMAGMVN